MSEQTVHLWQEIKKNLEKELPEASFETWVNNLEPVDLQDGRIELSAPSGFIKRGLEERYLDLIKSTVKQLTGEEKEVSVQVAEPEERDEATESEENLDGTSLQPPPVSSGGNSTEEPSSPASSGGGSTPLEGQERTGNTAGQMALNREYTFDNFVKSKSNQLASAASRAVAESPAESYNPLFLYSKVGLGKTHLLHSIGNYLKKQNPAGQVIYTSSERFAIEMIQAIRQNKNDEFRNKYRSVQAFLLDDVQFLENKEGTQEELFHTFNELYGNDKQIVLTSDRSPQEFSDLQDRLVSRFRWGLVADIQPPNFETRVAILRKKAAQKGLKVDDEVLELIATRVSTNVRALEGALIKAVAHANLAGGKLKIEEVRSFLPDESSEPKELTVGSIKEVVTSNYDLSIEDLEGKSRKKEIARARHIAIYLSRELTDSSFPALGKKFGSRDHSTVMHSHKKIDSMIEDTPLLYEEIKELKEEIRSSYEA
ncbi:MAG: chromosomal replication initiator protein DnaA [Candidatus Bipolaricaulota bacterium]|nr:chromosomal replication initiator protein DnaA [Candidatus Bipolaricaulota bacterium]MBS3791160.1 chromosomal replication initiator protein DnaA [Candidatus Bipolaricaulota bacterium]